jgi:hypothetical protein
MAKTRDYDRDNEEAAAIILADPVKYDGLMLKWAKSWMERHKTASKPLARAAHAGTEEMQRKHG